MKIMSLNEWKINESRGDSEYIICTTSPVGTIIDEDVVYMYCEKLHWNSDDFVDGDLGERIERNRRYKLKEIEISKIDIDEWEIQDEFVEEYKEKYQVNSKYPPIVLDKIYQGRYTIIDGTHRVNAIHQLGLEKVLAWVGI